MTELKDLKAGDEVTLTIKTRVDTRHNEDGVEYAYFDFANNTDYIYVEEGHVNSGAVTIDRAPRPLPTEPGLYIPATNSESPEGSYVYRLDLGDEDEELVWTLWNGYGSESGNKVLDQLRNTHQNLGGLVRLVPEQ